MTATAPVTVLVPVYGAVDDVERCLRSVVCHPPEFAFELVVIDDASPGDDVPALLRRFASIADAAAVPFRHVRNPSNLGFVKTVNAGLRAAAGDVVVLNSDTVVTAGWLDRLHSAASAPGVATVTPLTNFGSICTVPAGVIAQFELDGTDPRIDECAAFVEESSVGARPEIVTGVGFCMYTTRAAIDAVGVFDEDAFGDGYGEEVDFCLRASAAGFRHLAEDSTFVFHRGHASFGGSRGERMARASELLHARHPGFRDRNARERRRDPLALTFAAFDRARHRRDPRRPHVLHLLHNSLDALGGTEKHLRSLIDALLPEFDFSILYPGRIGFELHTIWNLGPEGVVERDHLLTTRRPDSASLDDDSAAEALAVALDAFGFDAVHVQNLIGHSLTPLSTLAGFDGQVVCSVRDLYLACPNHWLMYRNETPCGIPDDLSLCAGCLGATRELDVAHLEAFRSRIAQRLATVDTWVFASRSAADYMLRVYDLPADRIEVIEHGAIITIDDDARAVDRELVLFEPLRLAFVGLGWDKKGLRTVNALADAFADSSVEVHHFGISKGRASAELHTHGPYDNELLPELLQRAGIQIVLLPGPYAETFGHVMTEALASGRPVIGSRHGALAERITKHRVGWTVDPADVEAARELVENLDRCRDEVLMATKRAAAVPLPSVADTAGRYADLYRGRRLVPGVATG